MKKNMKLWHKVLIGLIFGIIFGVLVRDWEGYIYIKALGNIFIKMIQMIIAPLVFFAIVGGIASVSDSRVLGRLGLKAAFSYLATTSFAIFIGFVTAWILQPGKNLNLSGTMSQLPTPEGATFYKILTDLINIIPDNAIGAMVNGAILQVVFFAVFTGITIQNLSDVHKKKVSDLFELMSAIIFKMVELIVRLSPYSAFALTAWVVGTEGVGILFSLSKLVIGMIVACMAQYIIFGIMIYIFARVSPWPFYKKSIEYQAIAFSASSTKAALSTTIRVAQERLGISKASSSFIIPLGASINMDGMAIYLGLCAIFFAQAFGKTLLVSDYVVIMFTATLGSIGGAGVPGGSMMMLPMVLSSVGLPIEGIALIAGVDRILDMIRTIVNITGDVAVTLCVDQSEGGFNPAIYYKNDSKSDDTIA